MTGNGCNAPRRAQSSTVVIVSTFIGSAIEWYDFFIYGTVAALVFNKLFFPTFDPLVGTLAAFATFSVGFLARPLGGVIIGHYGDRVGRKAMLLLTLLTMGIVTVAIGLLPTYEQIGFMAPLLLVLLRLVQGFALGGEWGGAALVAFEHAPEGRRGFFGSWPQTGVAAGLVLSTIALGLASMVSGPAFETWGWRLPFLFSAVLIILGLVVRLRLSETPDFVRTQTASEVRRLPIVDVFRENTREVILVIGARLAENTLFYLVTVFALSYATQTLGIQRDVFLNGLIMAACVAMVTTPLFGALSDRMGFRRLYLLGTLAMIGFAVPFFSLLETGNEWIVQAAIVLGIGIVYPMMYGPQVALFASLFPARIRYSGISVGVQAGSVIGGGMTPLIATGLLAMSGGESWPVAIYAVVMATIAFVCTLAMKERGEKSATFAEVRLMKADRSTSA